MIILQIQVPKNEYIRMWLGTRISNWLWFIIDHLAYQLKGFAKLYEKHIGCTYLKEYANIQVIKKCKVLHIGCGAYPLTDILIAKYPFVEKVIGIDCSSWAVQCARDITAKKRLSHCIHIEKGDGCLYPVKDFDIVIISGCSQPKLEVLHQIMNVVTQDTLVLLRELNHSQSLILRYLQLHPEIRIINRINHKSLIFPGPFGWQTFFLQKK